MYVVSCRLKRDTESTAVRNFIAAVAIAYNYTIQELMNLLCHVDADAMISNQHMSLTVIEALRHYVVNE